MTSPCTLPLSAWVGKGSTRDRGWCAARDDSPLTDLHLLTYYTYLLMYLLTYLRARRPRGYQEVPARTRALPRADVSREQSVVSTNLLTCLLLTNTCLLLTCLLKGLTASAASDGTRRRRMHACATPTGAQTRAPSR